MNIGSVSGKTLDEFTSELGRSLKRFEGQEASLTIQVGSNKDGSFSANLMLSGFPGVTERDPLNRMASAVMPNNSQ